MAEIKPINNTWESKCNHAELLRIYAGFSLTLGLVGVVLFYTNRHHPGGHDLSSLIYPACFLIILGFTNLFGRRIPAIVFSLISGLVAGWHIVGGIGFIFHNPIAFVANILIGLVVILPLYSTIRGWQALR